MVIHTVRQGDTIYSLSRKYGTTVQKIIADNGLENINHLVIGQAIVIDVDSVRHTVLPGESLYSIARMYNTTVFRILGANEGITDPSSISVGQILIIPFATEKSGTIEVNGYARTDIENTILERTLPHLTYLSIFSYQVKPDGSLTAIQDGPLIEAARRQSVAPMMVITNIQEGGGFGSELANTILTNEALQDTLLNNVISIMEEKNYFGLDIDFEYIFPRDRENYNNFLKKAVDRLHSLGYIVTTALAPKTSGSQSGLLYEAHDYATHGLLADHVILMTYEWGYLMGPPRSVAPVNLVEDVIQYAVSVMPSRKIFMGIPNYGYDWTLPYVQGTAARPLTNVGAVNLASQVGANIQFDKTAQSPFFNYYDRSGKQHIVWFEDARSIEAKLKLVAKYNLGGVSYWTVNSFFPQGWVVQNNMFNIRKVL
ncbi:MAG: Spore germination protein YaaH [Eubacteriales bacterium]